MDESLTAFERWFEDCTVVWCSREEAEMCWSAGVNWQKDRTRHLLFRSTDFAMAYVMGCNPIEGKIGAREFVNKVKEEIGIPTFTSATPHDKP